MPPKRAATAAAASVKRLAKVVLMDASDGNNILEVKPSTAKPSQPKLTAPSLSSVKKEENITTTTTTRGGAAKSLVKKEENAVETKPSIVHVKKEEVAAAAPVTVKKEKTDDDPITETTTNKKKRGHTLISYEDETGVVKTVKEPLNWREVWDKIEVMRKQTVAPVDQMGCDALPDKEQRPEVVRFQILVSAMLSSQTRDEVTSKAVKNLQNHGLTVENILKTPEKKISELIYPVGFYPTKAKNLLRVCQILKDKHNGDVPLDLPSLLALPGIGPKMAHLTINVATGSAQGICVDTHVHRISNRLGWVKTWKGREEDTRIALQEWLPKERWHPINHMLVGFGQTICRPVKPLCESCLAKDLCPSAFRTHLEASKKSRN